jgi:hypothetical protein
MAVAAATGAVAADMEGEAAATVRGPSGQAPSLLQGTLSLGASRAGAFLCRSVCYCPGMRGARRWRRRRRVRRCVAAGVWSPEAGGEAAMGDLHECVQLRVRFGSLRCACWYPLTRRHGRWRRWLRRR